MQLLIHLLSLVLTLSVAATDAKICEVIHNKLTLLSTLQCAELSDNDFPLEFANTNFEGHYSALRLIGMGPPSEKLTKIPSKAVQGVSFDQITLTMENVESISKDFLTETQQSNVKRMEFRNFAKLRSFPWQTLSPMSKLEHFVLSYSGLTTVEADISWPSTIRTIDLGYNSKLELVKSNAFKSATELEQLSMWSSSSKIVFEDQSLYTTANNATFQLYFGYVSNISKPMFADDAFGNIGGGQLWDTLVMRGYEFREDVFRLMLKAKFDKNADHLLKSNFGAITIDGCMDGCTHAWVYQDAKNFGMTEYEKLLGSNVYCNTGGPILSGGDPDLYAHFEGCPKTPMPWPKNYCKDVPVGAMDVIADPEDCHCFFHCNNHEVAGHECCKPGLAFNPVLKACDWAYNVPSCD